MCSFERGRTCNQSQMWTGVPAGERDWLYKRRRNNKMSAVAADRPSWTFMNITIDRISVSVSVLFLCEIKRGGQWLTLKVLLLRHGFQVLLGFFCFIDITNIQRKHSPRQCAKQREKGKPEHCHSEQPAAARPSHPFCLFKTDPNTQPTASFIDF